MISYICILVSLFIPLGCAGFAKFSGQGYDNRSPREFLDKQVGKRRRADYAQKNFYETFPAFAVGVVAAHQLHVPTVQIDLLAVVYVISRIAYAFFYIQDQHVLRTTSWMLAMLAILGLYIFGIA